MQGLMRGNLNGHDRGKCCLKLLWGLLFEPRVQHDRKFLGGFLQRLRCVLVLLRSRCWDQDTLGEPFAIQLSHHSRSLRFHPKTHNGRSPLKEQLPLLALFIVNPSLQLVNKIGVHFLSWPKAIILITGNHGSIRQRNIPLSHVELVHAVLDVDPATINDAVHSLEIWVWNWTWIWRSLLGTVLQVSASVVERFLRGFQGLGLFVTQGGCPLGGEHRLEAKHLERVVRDRLRGLYEAQVLLGGRKLEFHYQNI